MRMVLIRDFAASLRYGIFAIAAVLPLIAHASPSVNVALQAPFDSAPYLLELL